MAYKSSGIGLCKRWGCWWSFWIWSICSLWQKRDFLSFLRKNVAFLMKLTHI